MRIVDGFSEMEEDAVDSEKVGEADEEVSKGAGEEDEVVEE